MNTTVYETEYTFPKDLGAAIVEILGPSSKDKVYDSKEPLKKLNKELENR